jgi:hypothetical protein
MPDTAVGAWIAASVVARTLAVWLTVMQEVVLQTSELLALAIPLFNNNRVKIIPAIRNNWRCLVVK